MRIIFEVISNIQPMQQSSAGCGIFHMCAAWDSWMGCAQQGVAKQGAA
jgi:hypothetical protein